MAVQRALTCRDIVTEIFERVGCTLGALDCDVISEMDEAQSRETLASSARVCWAFSESALSVLWRSLSDVDVVFKLLPSYCEHHDSDGRYSWFISEEVTPDQWARVQWYAKRVRALRNIFSFNTMRPAVWALLEGVRGDQPLLPNLFFLNACVSIEDPSGFMHLLPPSLRTLNITFDIRKPLEQVSAAEASLVGTVLRAISSRVSHLHELYVHDMLPYLPSSSLTFLRNFHQMRTLRIESDTFGSEALFTVSQMSSLSVLEVDISLQTATEALKLANDFGLLSELHITGSLVQLCRFFTATHLRNLRQQAFHDALVRITANVSPLLTEIRIYPTGDAVATSATYTSSQILRPLLRFGQLTVFVIFFNFTSEYSPKFVDDDIATFAASWRKLDDFCVAGAGTTRCNLTLSSLIAFAHHCPSLRYLELPMLDIKTLPPQSSVPGFARGSMRHLHVNSLVGSSEVNLLHFAVLVDRLYPSLNVPQFATTTSFKADMGSDWNGWNAWLITQLLLGAIQLSRAHLVPDLSDVHVLSAQQ
ncbi:hypothetical protein L227DRAFT_587588 [Lentinus tigrinus ALCF2SS1-6]|uniref:F-box domain-containing protein n=1 Tax=Lentinus tigrinus ALCF2SS1-6 TaxID=1328759 RepID=A0A5C2S3A7_9APHY|nr:hypothetical protein L227DRAFT_587588 [Lentinus tigrinus ALCF2SS1-6]